MPRTAMVQTSIPAHGKLDAVPFAAVDSVNGMRFRAVKNQILLVKNDSGAPVTVTAQKVADRAGRTGTTAAIVAAAGIGALGPFNTAVYVQSGGADAGFVQVDFTAAASITYALLEVNI